ncbi:MAG: hypothetical protein GTO71_12465 [Woeseiaceae bacterium]|nr:hypothetical protein [Woeseiaceae bacterium]NIP21880.1 hypothetical protein [Woeseiaceae bacterium]NIS90965.1 hypothetical protein [Woeseiaceae bacterium]
MRKSGGLAIPLTLIVFYYTFWITMMWYLLSRYPGLGQYFPIGGIEFLAGIQSDTFEPIYSFTKDTVHSPQSWVQLAIACVGAVILTIPVTWAYFITSRARRIDQSFVQTIMILPVVVTGISMIVLNSLALAFSLAGIVAAVRFRFALSQPSDAMYIFVSIGVGLGSGIGALGVATVISIAFVFSTMVIWRLEYGKTLSGRFLTMLTRRDAGDDEYDD